MHILQMTVVAILAVGCVHGMIEHRYGPENTQVRQGLTATLFCAFDEQGTDRVFWYRLGTGELLSQNEHVSQGSHPAMGRYVITGNHREGEYNLQITDVQSIDSDEYRCGFERGEDHIYEGALLKVLVPPAVTYPACLMMTEHSEIGEITKLSCVSTGGNPPATLTWELNGKAISPPKTKSNVLERRMQIDDVGARFTCIAQSPAMYEMRSCAVQPLQHMPSVMVSPRVGYTNVGDSLTFSCQKQDQRPEDSYVWYFNGEKVLPDIPTEQRFRLSDNKKSLTVTQIGSKDNNAEIVCKVDNGITKMVAATATLSVEGTDPKNKDDADPNVTPVPPGRGDSQYMPTTSNNSKIALIAVSIIGGLAIAALAAIIYLYVQRKIHKKPRQTTIPMSQRNSTSKSFRRSSSLKKSCRRKGSAISAPESYAALNMSASHDGKYTDLKSVSSCSSIHAIGSSLPLMMTACALPLPPITPSAPPLSIRVPSHTNIQSILEDAESNDSYETIDEKILKSNRTENKPPSEYLEILP